ncbi:MAG: hypothetical protein WB680_00435, partial [Candidatus Acidiferrales bacterium]
HIVVRQRANRMAFDFNCVNTFKINDPQAPTGFVADLDENAAGNGPILGDMKIAASPQVISQDDAEGGGVLIAFSNPTGQPASETIYVVNPLIDPDADNAFNIFNSAPNLLAELEFESPFSVMADGSPNAATPWAVGRNFKTGNETDGANDTILGPTCQFVNGGNVNFNFVDNPQSTPGTYDHFDNAGTRFLLTLSLQRTVNSVEAGASLAVGDDVLFISAITDSDLGINLTQARTAPAKITAIGVAVVNRGKDMNKVSQPASDVSVRLIAFRLHWDFPKIDFTKIPLIRP